MRRRGGYGTRLGRSMTARSAPAGAETLIRELRLEPHPEGGYFRETYRSRLVDGHGRAASTLIYFLLARGQVSRLHRIDADEGWHLYLGGPLDICELDERAAADGLQVTRLGTDVAAGERPQHLVPAGRWFGASLPERVAFALVGCSVAPGFEFFRFELADRAQLTAQFPRHRDLIARLTRSG